MKRSTLKSALSHNAPADNALSHLNRFHVPKADYFRIFTSFYLPQQTFSASAAKYLFINNWQYLSIFCKKMQALFSRTVLAVQFHPLHDLTPDLI